MSAIVSCEVDGWQFFALPSMETRESEGKKWYLMKVVSPAREFGRTMSYRNDKPPSGLLPISKNSILIMFQGAHIPLCTYETSDSWKTTRLLNTENADFFSQFISKMEPTLPSLSATSNLAKVRDNGNFDFTIACIDGNIEVHSVVLESQWPFFKAMQESQMQEKETRTLTLNYRVLWIEALVSHLYEERKPLEFDVATGLLEVAQVYDISELLNKAMRRIKAEKMDINQSMSAWKQAYIAENEAVRKYCIDIIRQSFVKSNGVIEDSLLDEFTKEQFVQLHRELSGAVVEQK